jgi:hypothetical protein
MVATQFPARPRFLVRAQFLTRYEGPAQAASRAPAEAAWRPEEPTREAFVVQPMTSIPHTCRRRRTMRGNVTWIARVGLLGSVVLAGIVVHPVTAAPAMVGNAACPGEEVFFDPGNGEDIIVPEGYRVEVFAKGLNFPTAIAFAGNQKSVSGLRVGVQAWPAQSVQ